MQNLFASFFLQSSTLVALTQNRNIQKQAWEEQPIAILISAIILEEVCLIEVASVVCIILSVLIKLGFHH